MFPPKPTEEIEEWALGLWQSIQRASENFLDEIERDELSEGKIRLMYHLRSPTPLKAHAPLLAYVREYGAASGWKIHQVILQKRHLIVVASKLTSSVSKKR